MAVGYASLMKKEMKVRDKNVLKQINSKVSFENFVSKGEGITILDLSSLGLSPEEEDKLFVEFLASL
jgi:hypothetical protein